MKNENPKSKIYAVIDLKSFYASVECVERGLDPFKADLVVADASRGSGGICLAVSPALRAKGVKNRCRLFEIPRDIKFIIAPPRMQFYIDYAARIYEIYLKYVSKEDIYVYSIDECFIDLTSYLKFYALGAKEMAKMMMNEILKTTGVTATCGMGTNLYLAKIALDILAKHQDDGIAYLDEELYKKQLWTHQPLSDFWRIGKQTRLKLEKCGIFCMKDIANAPKSLLEKIFGVDAYITIDHANGIEPTTIAEIKAYKPSTKSYFSSEILPRDYERCEAVIVLKEMVDRLALRLINKDVRASGLTINVRFADKLEPQQRASVRFKTPTNISSVLMSAAEELLLNKIKNVGLIRQIGISANDVVKENLVEFSLFEDDAKEKAVLKSLNLIKEKFGKNSILRAIDLLPEATGQDRNKKIGGHKSGE